MNAADAQKYLLNITTFSLRGKSWSGGCITYVHTAKLSQKVSWEYDIFQQAWKKSDDATEKQQ